MHTRRAVKTRGSVLDAAIVMRYQVTQHGHDKGVVSNLNPRAGQCMAAQAYHTFCLL